MCFQSVCVLTHLYFKLPLRLDKLHQGAVGILNAATHTHWQVWGKSFLRMETPQEHRGIHNRAYVRCGKVQKNVCVSRVDSSNIHVCLSSCAQLCETVCHGSLIKWQSAYFLWSDCSLIYTVRCMHTVQTGSGFFFNNLIWRSFMLHCVMAKRKEHCFKKAAAPATVFSQKRFGCIALKSVTVMISSPPELHQFQHRHYF